MPKQREKKVNTFKFKNFEELIQVDILLKKQNKLDPNEESHLAECFNKWTTLNCSLEFSELRNKLGPKILTLSLLLINEEEVVNILFEHINNCTSLSVATILDLLQSLVCDIREDFMPYLEKSFVIITELIERSDNDPDMLLNAFNCIAHMLTFLERTLVKDIHILFPMIKPLLFHTKKHYIRHFTAQSLAYLLRKSKNFKELFSVDILNQLVDSHSNNHSDAIGKLMSSCLKIKDELFSTAPRLFAYFFQILVERSDSDVLFFIQCFEEMFKDLLKNLNVAGYRDIWKMIVEQISNSTNNIPSELTLLVMELFFKYAKEKYLNDCSASVVRKITQLVKENPSDKIVEISKLLINKLPVSSSIEEIVRAIILTNHLEMDIKFQFAQEFIGNLALEMAIKHCLNCYLTSFVTEQWLSDCPDNLYKVLRNMANLVMFKYPINKENSWKNDLGNVNFNLFFTDNNNQSLVKSLLNIVTGEETNEKEEEMFWLTSIIIPHLHPVNTDKRFLNALKTKLEPFLKSEFNSSTLLKINTILDCLVYLNCIQGLSFQIDLDLVKFINLLDNYDFTSTLEPVLMEIIYKSLCVETRIEDFIQFQDKFLNKLKSPNHKSRLNAIRILQILICNDELVSSCLNKCEEIEKLFELHETKFVSKERFIYKMLDELFYKSTQSTKSKEISINYLLGLFHVQFEPLWKNCIKALSSYYVAHSEKERLTNEEVLDNEKILWPNIKDQLDYCTTQVKSEHNIEAQVGFSCDIHQQYTMDRYYKNRNTNWLVYRLNIIKCLTKIPELGGKKTATLSPLLLNLYSEEFLTNKSPKQLREDTLCAMMEMFSQFPNIVGTHSEQQLKKMYYKCLASRKSSLQKAAFQVIVNYKMPELMHYKTQINEILDKNIDGLKQMALSQILPSHRQVLVPIMLRIVVGKLKDNTQRKKQKPLISYLLELEEEEISHLMAIVMEGLKIMGDKYDIVQADEDITSITKQVRQNIQSNTMPPFVLQSFFKTLHGVCGSLKSIFESLLNKLSYNNLSSILQVVLDFYACCNHVKTSYQDITIAQLKSLRQDSANIVLFYFSKLEDFSWTEEQLSLIQQLIVKPQITNLILENQTSVNTTIQLALLWSEKEEFVPLINEEMFDSFVKLLNKTKLNREVVGYKLVSIVYNLMQHAINGRIHSNSLQTMICNHLTEIISYLASRVKNLKIKKLKPLGANKLEMNETTTTRKELLMINIAVGYVLDTQRIQLDKTIIKEMINNILIVLYKMNAMILTNVANIQSEDLMNEVKEQLEVDFIRALQSMCDIIEVSDILIFFERVLGLFCRLRKRASRMVLSSFVSSIWPKLYTSLAISHEFSILGDIANKLNSWSESRLEEMDCDVISSSIETVLEILKVLPISKCINDDNNEQFGTSLHPNLWLYNMTCQNCLFILSDIPEIGTRQMAIDFMESLISSIAMSQSNKIINILFYQNIWPFIKHGIAIKNDLYRFSFITLIKSVVQNFGMTERFKDISKLGASEGDDHMNFFDNMLSLTMAFNSKGLRQLVRFLSHNMVSEDNLRDVILPLVLHRIDLISLTYNNKDRSSLTHAHRESLNSSFEALSEVSKQLPIQLYQKLVTEQMTRLDKGCNVELVIKTLVSLLNGYNSSIDEENHSFIVNVLHKLEQHLSKRLANEMRHKKAQKSAQIDLMDKKDSEWTSRGMTLQVPIALAIINIVVKLPKKYMKEIITKVVLRICDFLKAKEVEVRKEAGTTLYKMLEIINSPERVTDGTVRYLGFIIQTIKSHLDRGFQRHVALYTCHRVLQRLMDIKLFDRLSVDNGTIKNMSELYLDELFGIMAREKVERDTAEKGIVKEAKQTKAFEGFRMLGNILGKDQLLDFFERLVNKSKEFQSRSNLQKFQQIFEGIQSKGGLTKNRRLDPVLLFTLSVMLIRDNLDALFTAETNKKMIKIQRISNMDNMHVYVPPTRLDGHQAPISHNSCTSTHLIINCAFSLIHGLCKLYQSSTEINICAMIDPVLPYLMKVLDQVQYKIIRFSAIKCLKELIRLNPPSLSEKIEDLCALLFRIHDKNSLASDIQDTISENLTSVFNKTITQFIQRSDVHLNTSQYQVLLLSIQVDSLNSKRQMTSFNLLRAIIENKIKEPARNENVIILNNSLEVQISDIIKKVRELALISCNERTRLESRLTIAAYFKMYRQPQKSLMENVLFFLKQLCYIDEDGQLSSCLILQNLMKEYSSTEINLAQLSSCVIAIPLLSMETGVTEKVEKVYIILINQVMHLVDSEKQKSLCNMVLEYFGKFELDSRKIRISFLFISEMIKALQTADRVLLSMNLVNIMVEKLPQLIEVSHKINNQLAASQGKDAELMLYLENKAENIKKKRKIDNEEIEGNDIEECNITENSEKLSNKMSDLMGNINGLLTCLSSLLTINYNNQSDVSILNHLMESFMTNNTWFLITKRLLRTKHTNVRLNATSNVIKSALTLEVEFENKTNSSFASLEIITEIIAASFSQWKNEQILPEECNAVLINLLLVWHIIINNFDGDVKAELGKSIVDGANNIAKNELLNGKSLIRRCAVLKLMAGICKKTSVEDMKFLNIRKSLLYMWMREERQSQDEKASDKKQFKKRTFKSIETYCGEQEIMDWKTLVISVGEVIRIGLGEEKCKHLTLAINKQRSADKVKRKIEESALIVSNPGEALHKKLKKSHR